MAYQIVLDKYKLQRLEGQAVFPHLLRHQIIEQSKQQIKQMSSTLHQEAQHRHQKKAMQLQWNDAAQSRDKESI